MFANLLRCGRQTGARSTSRSQACRGRKLVMESLESRQLLAQTIGLQVNDAEAFAGYTLFAPSGGGTTYLIDNQGEQINEWQSDFPPMSAYLQPDGSLLRVARLANSANTLNAPGAAGRIELFDWQGNLTWSYELSTPNRRLHHDIELMPNGNLLLIAWDRYSRSEALAAGRDPNLPTDNDGEVWPDIVLELQPDYAAGVGGEIVWEWSLWDHLVQDRLVGAANFGSVSDNPQRVDVNYVSTGEGAGGVLADWTHFNGIDYNPELDQIIVSSREFSEFWIIDHSTTTAEAQGSTGGNSGQGGDLLYRWGNARAYDRGSRAGQELFYQHDAQWIEPGLPGAGNILVFNNGWNRQGGANYSSVVELSAPNNEQWLLNNETDGSIDNLIIFGTSRLPAWWTPITGDWDNDGIDTAGFYDPEGRTWYLNNAAASWDYENQIVMSGLAAAGESWIPVAGDWNNDGFDTPGLYDPLAQRWHLSNGSQSWTSDLQFLATGVDSGWLPLAGDFAGDGFETVGLYDPDSHDWYLNNDVGAWQSPLLLPAPADVPGSWRPIAGDWNGNGLDSVGLYDPQNHQWYLNNRIDGSASDLIIIDAPEVPEQWAPLSGDWNNDGVDSVGLYDASSYSIYPDQAYAPANPEVVYTSQPLGEFFATIISGMQRLPNGNTLINEGTEGRFFEITPAGKIVWEYISPVVAGDVILDQGATIPVANIGIPGVLQNLVFRATRYGTDYLDPSLDVTPGGTIEANPFTTDTIGFYDPTTNDWSLNNRIDGSVSTVIEVNEALGEPATSLPVTGDWNGDGTDTIGIYAPETMTWRLNNRSDGSTTDLITVTAAGADLNANWLPISGDWDNDGIDTVGLYDPISNNWYLNNATSAWENPGFLPAPVDVPSTWVPITGDWDGASGDSVGLYDPDLNNWYLNNRIDGGLDVVTLLAPVDVPASWIPVTGDWNSDGLDSVGLYSADNRRWYLNNRVDGSISDLIVVSGFGPTASQIPVSGDWNAQSSPRPASAGGNQYVNDALLLDWQDHFGAQAYVSTTAYSPDRDGDGDVDGGDFLAWQRGVGSSYAAARVSLDETAATLLSAPRDEMVADTVDLSLAGLSLIPAAAIDDDWLGRDVVFGASISSGSAAARSSGETGFDSLAIMNPDTFRREGAVEALTAVAGKTSARPDELDFELPLLDQVFDELTEVRFFAV